MRPNLTSSAVTGEGTPTLDRAVALLVGPGSARIQTLQAWLAGEGYEVRTTTHVDKHTVPGTAGRPDVVVLDVGAAAPGLVADLRGQSDLVIIALDTGRGTALRAALDVGADDYLAVPLRRSEVIARIRLARQRRQRPKGNEGEAKSIVTTPDFQLDLQAQRAVTDGKVVHLTPTEWRIVEALARSPGVLLSRESIIATVWGSSTGSRAAGLRVHLSAIRRKLEPDPARPRYFTTEAGAGLRFDAGRVDHV